MKAILVALFFLIPAVAFADNKITLSVGLSPAGSFQAISQKAKGTVIKQGETFTAEKITVGIETFKTGIDLRDEHTWKHMNSSNHPNATLSEIKAQDGTGTGNLEVNGIKKPVKITYKVIGQDVHARFSVKASDFGMKKAEYLGVRVNDLIQVEATLPFKTR